MKKGFIFIETLIVMVVLLITVLGMFGMYTKLSTNIETRKYYDNISDLYKTDIIRNNIDITLIENTLPIIEVNPTNCTSYMESSCTDLLLSLQVEKIIINNESINSIILTKNNGLNNSLREYLKTINQNDKRFIIVHYKYDNKNYYASLRI